MKRPRRIAIFGGTFDPIHAGHLRSARIVGRRFGLDRILFVPASIPPHKARPDMAPAAERYRMVQLAVAGRGGWTVSPVEIRAGGTSYSIRTIERMRRRFPGAHLFFITGADAFRDIKTWREWERVLRSCVFIVTTRPGAGLEASVRGLGPKYAGCIRKLGRTGSVREDELIPGRIFLLPIDALSVSSTEIRKRARLDRPLGRLAPPAVAAHIRARRLYEGGF
ncbi:MAG: nicotinate-nucleotide adenylyltransferase [Candidatus Aminicenantes bacterium]|nr:nicotinate-nucleotide adenylyltransferase [Candidatus Aminicenantes bacterium]